MEDNLIADWAGFCKGEKQFDKCHFYTLFHEQLSLEDIHTIFQYFGEDNELEKRFLNVYHTGLIYANPHPVAPSPPPSKETLITICQAILKEQIKVFTELDDQEMLELLKDASIAFTSDLEAFEELQPMAPHVMVRDRLNDYFINGKSRDWSKMAIAIDESFYGLKGDFELNWYLSAPIYNTSYNTDFYFELWKNKVDYLITDDAVLLAFQVE